MQRGERTEGEGRRLSFPGRRKRGTTFLQSDHRAQPALRRRRLEASGGSLQQGPREQGCKGRWSLWSLASVTRARVARKPSTGSGAAPHPSRRRSSGCSSPTWHAAEDPTPPSRAVGLPRSSRCSHALTSLPSSALPRARVPAAAAAAAPPWRLQG